MFVVKSACDAAGLIPLHKSINIKNIYILKILKKYILKIVIAETTDRTYVCTHMFNSSELIREFIHSGLLSGGAGS